ncbi:MAG: hypothetical protein ABJB17_00230 [Burkholderiales bacterium]
MATPNYGFEKRQKELAKKRKKEEKLKNKAVRKIGPDDGSEPQDDQENGGAADTGDAAEAGTGPASS